MEILALLLLGLIAMLAIVPPIIRGKLEDSPLATTQSFQRSMKEIASSIESPGRSHGAHPGARAPRGYRAARPGGEGRLRPVPARIPRRSRAAVRRGRIMVSLTLFASLWGIATLISGRPWCLVIFAISCGLLVAFWGMALIVPNLPARPREEEHADEPRYYPRRHAL